MWDLPRPGIEPTSPALAGRFLTTVPPGKPHYPILQIRKLKLPESEKVMEITQAWSDGAEIQIPVSLTPEYMFFTKVILFMLHFHVEISLEEAKEHYAQFAPNIVTASPRCVFFLSSLLPAEIILYIQICNMTFSTLCFSILLHRFYSHHFNDVHNIPLLGRC